MRLNKATRYLKISYIIHTFFFFTLEGNCFIEFCGFPSCISKDEPSAQTSPPPEPCCYHPPQPALRPVTQPLLEFPKSHGKLPLASYLTFGIVNFHFILSIHLPFSLLPSSMSTGSLSLFLHCFPENKFIKAIFLDSIYVCVNIQYLYFSFWLCMIGTRFSHLIRTDSNVFLFMTE